MQGLFGTKIFVSCFKFQGPLTWLTDVLEDETGEAVEDRRVDLILLSRTCALERNMTIIYRAEPFQETLYLGKLGFAGLCLSI